ncbi:hypothetical protein IH922_07150 [candidate division KSB1 bacterium]|nr:hypothetical protein [candidate division KSB1 bacterium]
MIKSILLSVDGSTYTDAQVKYCIQLAKAFKCKIKVLSIVDIRIRDKGIGILQGELKTVFRRFYRVQNGATHAAKGTGLGLYIVRSVIKKHGGKVIARSKGRGKGSTFIVRLPKIV